MSNPAGTRANRWNQMVNAVSVDLGLSTRDADSWLNSVWGGMYGDEEQGNPSARAALRARLETDQPDAPTLPEALKRSVV